MASITSMVNGTSSLSSIYGSRNVLSGLASGMDTETMIENAVSGIKLKIQNLTKKRTKIEWQQEAYRSIIDKAANFNTKYTSYSSKTNLLSNSFFSNAVNTTTLGTYKDKISASGKTNSDIRINAVKQMAKAASYTVSGLGGQEGIGAAILGGDSFDIAGDLDVNAMSGSLSFQYGGTNGATFDISFDDLENLNDVKVYNADGTEKTDASNAEKLAQAINNKLGEITYNYTKNGFQESTTADKAIKVTANPDGRISFSDGLGNGNTVKIGSSSGNIKEFAGENVIVVPSRLTEPTPTYEYLAGKQGTDGKWSGGKELSVTLDGVTKKISMSDLMNKINDGFEDSTAAGKDKNEMFLDGLQSELDDAFGAGKIQVNQDGESGKLSFKALKDGSTLSLNGTAAEALGFEKGDSNYINTSKKLKDLMGGLFSNDNLLKAVGDVKADSSGRLTDAAGNRVKLLTDDQGNAIKDADGKDIYHRVDNNGKALYDFQINGSHINVNEDTTLESLINSINSNAEAGVKVSYSKLTNEFKFTATETGANSRIEFDGMAKDMFGDPSASKVKLTSDSKLSDVLGAGLQAGKFTMKVGDETLSINRNGDSTIGGTVYWLQDAIDKSDALKDQGIKASYDYENNTFVFKDKDGKALEASYGAGMAQDFASAVEDKYVAGQDAVMDVEINGKRFENLTRSSNSFDLDGLTVNVKGEFTTGVDKDGNAEEPITFNTSTDSDKIVDAIRDFVNDYNEMVTEIKNAYSTMPAQRSNGARYEPLTAEQEEQYSESELKAYNEKAKQGILFGDSTLSSMYSKMLSAIAPGGTDGQALREIGIGTSYSSGLTTLSLDEDKLRAALDSDPDKVKNAFTKTRESGSSTDGLMQTMQNTLNTYVKTTGEPKGVLITRAGSVKSPTSLNSNSLKSQMDSIDNQIDRWTDKMADQIDRYTTQFSRLEQLIAEMNSQASAMSGLMGGSTGY